MSEEAPTIRQAIDPAGELPSVELIPPENLNPNRKGIVTDHYAVAHNGEVVGRASIQGNSRDNEEYFTSVHINERERGKGLGMATYLAAIEQAHEKGRAFRTHEVSQTEEAKRVWEKLIDTKLKEVVVIEPFVPGAPEDGDKYTGYVRIEPPVSHT